MDLGKYFDKIYVINLIDRSDRRKAMIQQFIDMGMEDDLLNGKIEFIEAVKYPCFTPEVLKFMKDNDIADFYSLATKSYNPGLFSCTMEHYRLLTQAYYKGYDRILVLEDDARFIKDENVFSKALETMPNDFDILHFEGFFWPINEDEYNMAMNTLSPTKEEGHWESCYSLRLFATAALAYTRQGIERYLSNQNDFLTYVDFYTFQMNTDSYFYTYPLAIQEESSHSDITQMDKNPNHLNIYNHYIKREEYN